MITAMSVLKDQKVRRLLHSQKQCVNKNVLHYRRADRVLNDGDIRQRVESPEGPISSSGTSHSKYQLHG